MIYPTRYVIYLGEKVLGLLSDEELVEASKSLMAKATTLGIRTDQHVTWKTIIQGQELTWVVDLYADRWEIKLLRPWQVMR